MPVVFTLSASCGLRSPIAARHQATVSAHLLGLVHDPAAGMPINSRQADLRAKWRGG